MFEKYTNYTRLRYPDREEKIMNKINPLQSCVRMLLLIPFIVRMCFPAVFSGVVVDKENGNKPIPGVLVSGGHTTSRTLTDEQGRFLLDAPQTNVLKSLTPFSKSFVTIIWDRRNKIIDLSRADYISAISIYTLKGSCLFRKDIRAKDRLLRIPSLPQGIFIVKAVFIDNCASSWKWTALDAHGVFNVPLLAGRALGKSASAGGDWLLLFRHDDYFPSERKYGGSAEGLVIAMRPDPCRTVFDQTKIHSYFFTVSHDDSLSMEKNAIKEEFIPADFAFDSVSFGKVGLRFKGSQYYLLPACFDSSGRNRTNPQCEKVSMKIKFDKYNDSARFFSLKRLNLHAMADDQSKMHEMLCYGLFREMGIYAPRTVYVKVFLNNSLWGLFTAVEEPDGRFTKSRWPSFGDGNLYKETWPNRLTYHYYEDGLVTNDKPTDSIKGLRMSALFLAITASSKETFVQNVSPFLDLDYWLRYIAVDRAIHNADGVMTWYYDPQSKWIGNHNFYLYEEENPGGKIWLLPWDLPATLTKTDPIIDDFDVPEWNVAPTTCDPMPIWGGSFGIPPHCDKLTGLLADALWDEFIGVGQQLVSSCFGSDHMKGRIDRYAALIDPAIAQDSTINRERWRSEVKDLRMTMDILNQGFDDYIHGRTPTVDTSGFLTPLPDSGFLLSDRVNNFELSPAIPLSSWTYSAATKGSTISIGLDTIAPLWGKSDLLCSFVFSPLDSPSAYYSEGADIGLLFQKEVDCAGVKRLRMHLKCDSPRYGFVYLQSKAYERKGVKNTFGWSLTIGAKNKQYTFDMATISYPTGGSSDNPDILDTVLASVQGVGFRVEGRFNNAGKLAVAPDSGYLRVDNVLFER